MNSSKCREIAEWFTEKHKEWIKDNKLVSWAGKLGINLNNEGVLDDAQLFHLFVLAVLWNNKPTYVVEKGLEVFEKIRDDYTLENFREAVENMVLEGQLKSMASKIIGNPQVFNLLMFIANGKLNGENVWTKMKKILNSPIIGDKEDDLRRLRQLYNIFNPPRYGRQAYLTVKIFLIFREIRIQFRQTRKYQYHPAICCIPDNNVRRALKMLNLFDDVGNNISSLIRVSQFVADNFCTKAYELYDLPLFFWYREVGKSSLKEIERTRPIQGQYAGICPLCGSPLVWRRARQTNELYRGCTNFQRCRWNDRSY